MKRKRCLVIIPAYNEEKKIARIVQDVLSISIVDEVAVIDDCSTDKTCEKARAAGATVIRLIANLGYGAALQTGYRYSAMMDYDVTVQMDGDGQHDPGCIEGLVETLIREKQDVVIGSRFLGSGKKYRAPLLRRVGMRFFQFLIYLIIKRIVTDPTSGYRALGKKVVQFYSEANVYPHDYPDADIILLLHNLGYRFCEVPVIMYENDGRQSMHSGIRPLYYVVKMILSMFSIVFGQYRTFLRRKS